MVATRQIQVPAISPPPLPNSQHPGVYLELSSGQVVRPLFPARSILFMNGERARAAGTWSASVGALVDAGEQGAPLSVAAPQRGGAAHRHVGEGAAVPAGERRVRQQGRRCVRECLNEDGLLQN